MRLIIGISSSSSREHISAQARVLHEPSYIENSRFRRGFLKQELFRLKGIVIILAKVPQLTEIVTFFVTSLVSNPPRLEEFHRQRKYLAIFMEVVFPPSSQIVSGFC